MKLTKYALIGIMALSSSAAMAKTNFESNSNTQGHPYVGFEIGMGGLNTPDIDANTPASKNAAVSGLNTDEEHQGFGYHVYGGYLFNINNRLSIGPEVGYAMPTDNTYTATVNSLTLPISVIYSPSYIDILASAKLNISPKFSMIAKLGFASVTQKIDVAILGKSQGQETAPEGVIGIAYNVNSNISLTANIDQVFTDGMTKQDYLNPDEFASITTYNVGMTYTL